MNLSKIFVNNTQIVSVDDDPTSGSDNLVKSGGVFSAIEELGIERKQVANEEEAFIIQDETTQDEYLHVRDLGSGRAF